MGSSGAVTERAPIMRGAMLALVAFGQPAAAPAAAPDPTAEEALAAWDAEFDAVMADARSRRRCPRGSNGEDIVVCGRADDQTMRVPYEPVPGEVHHVAGDLPTGGEAMAAGGCLRLCSQPVMVDIEQAIRFLARGADRLLHPD